MDAKAKSQPSAVRGSRSIRARVFRPRAGVDLYSFATALAIVFWLAIVLGAIFDLHGAAWLLTVAGVIALALAAKATSNLILKRRP